MEQKRDPRNKPFKYSQMIFDNSASTTQWGKGSVFNKLC